MTLRIELLGPPRVLRDGEPAPFETRKALALLSYLAATRRVHARDALAAIFWTDSDVAHARGALRRTLSAVRKVVGDEALEVDRSTVSLRSGAASVDVGEVRGHAAAIRSHGHEGSLCDECLDRAEAAAALMRGTFMEAFALGDAPLFEEWRHLEQDVLQNELIWILRTVAAARSERGEHEAALAHVGRWIALDPLQEPGHVMAMKLHAALGDRPAAIRQYRECVRILNEELGVSPLPSTVAAYRDVAGGGDASVQGEEVADPDPAALRELPLVGRDDALRKGRGALADLSKRGGVVFIEGEAGIGKTRLAQEILEHARGAGARTLELRCHEEERNHPYGTATRLITSLVEETPASAFAELSETSFVQMARLVPDVRTLRPEAPQASPLTDPGAKTLFFEGLFDAIQATTEATGQWVILLDDLHWSDAGTIELLSLLARRGRGTRILFLMTWRTEGIDAGHPIRRLVTELRSDTIHLELERLGHEDVSTLIAIVQPDASDDLAERIFGETEGVPFFVHEYLTALGRGHDDSAARERALDLVRSRVAAVAGVTQQVLSAAAVVGRSFPVGLLQSVAGRSEEETVDAIEDLTERGLVRPLDSVGAPTYDFTHELVREVVYGATSLARRRLLHRRTAEALTATEARRPEDVALAAHHYTHAGEEEAAAALHVRAGQMARTLFANAEALEHLDTALALGASEPAGLHEQIGDLRTLLGRYAAASDSYETAIALAPGALPRLSRKLAALAMRRGDAVAARMHLEEALGSKGEERPRVLAELSLAWAEDDPERARELAQQAADEARQAGDDAGEAQALNLLGLLRRRGGDPSGAAPVLRSSLARARSLPHPAPRIAALNNLALAERDTGRLPEAIALMSEALELCSRVGDVHREAALSNNLADLLHVSGDREKSQIYAKRAARLFAQVGERPSNEPGIWRLESW